MHEFSYQYGQRLLERETKKTSRLQRERARVVWCRIVCATNTYYEMYCTLVLYTLSLAITPSFKPENEQNMTTTRVTYAHMHIEFSFHFEIVVYLDILLLLFSAFFLLILSHLVVFLSVKMLYLFLAFSVNTTTKII